MHERTIPSGIRRFFAKASLHPAVIFIIPQVLCRSFDEFTVNTRKLGKQQVACWGDEWIGKLDTVLFVLPSTVLRYEYDRPSHYHFSVLTRPKEHEEKEILQNSMGEGSNLPPGFQFFPSDEELVVHFLRRKAAQLPCYPDIIPTIDLRHCDPWDLNGQQTPLQV
ncbi:hypothetical protein GW17_00045422 [Ensete ventricosum]|nr:hypothetical protein GW17_00045422 [Ensete ventricosum]